jgi:corrinoid protein of di/trimethylamine methyltransferase
LDKNKENKMENELIEKLKTAVIEGYPEEATKLARSAVKQGLDPIVAYEQGLTAGITQVGDAFGRHEMFLPDLVLAANSMKAAAEILEEEIARQGMGRKSLGTFVLGTVAGDIHDIGKAIVSTLLSAYGFNVVDLGIDVPADTFIQAVQDHEADIIGMCSMLTSTAGEMPKVIQALEKAGLRGGVRVMVGGGSITQEYADEVGADGYGENAEFAVRMAKDLLGIAK